MEKLVFITFQDDVFGGTEIAKVFSNKDDAIEYVIQTKFNGRSYYEKLSKNELRLKAEEHVEEHPLL